MKKLLHYFHLEKVGIPELIVAMYPVLEGYTYWGVPLRLVLLLLLDFFYLSQRKHRYLDIRAFYIIYFFILIHEIVLWCFIGFPTYMFNATLQLALTVGSIAIIGYGLDYEKLVNSIYWVTIISIGGLIYHYIVIASGGSPTPLKLPFLPSPITEVNRLDMIISRPTSFFQEPSAFGQYMLIPLFISLKDKSVINTIIIALMMFLSTSTNAIVFAVGMVIIYALAGRGMKWYGKIFLTLLGVGLVYIVLNSEFFEQGINKIENTEFSENVRVVNGYNYVSALSTSDLLLGIPAANPLDYYYQNPTRFNSHDVIVYDTNVYMTTIWKVLVKYGIIGLLLFILMYLEYYRRNKLLFPLMAILGLELFSQSTFFEVSQFVFLATFIYYYKCNNYHILNKKETLNELKYL